MPSSEVEGSHDASERSAGPKVSRKSHRKSRNGCLNCKRRRIKCNEERPQCGNCLKHSDRCSFLEAAHTSSSTGAHRERLAHHEIAQSASPQMNGVSYGSPASFSGTNGTSEGRVFGQSHVLNITDLELLHNYNTSTAATLSNIASLQAFYRVNVPKIAFLHEFLLHGILAISALHLSHFKKGEAQVKYQREADHHYEIALREATSALPNINEQTASALYLFGAFCPIITLALGPTPGDFLLFGNQGLTEWLLLFRGMKAILETNFEFLRHGELAPMFHISIHQVLLQSANDEHLQELREMITMTAREDPDIQLYLKALEELAHSFPPSSVPGTRSTQPSIQMVFVWLYRLSDEFADFLQQRRPIPMVILAYFCVLLHDLSSFWWAKGWAEHLMSEIHGSLSEQYRTWIRWPMEELGWIAG
ncbi:related to regulatory protein involved in control of sterol uptake [Phialocephala subalpina]|uniref:Related to regulatory protein involved in control of sterol uptake n=1 Tax=Phialocephala subalpina TaxID=576137 RepID=A0A1L7XCK4_9HELO|nr:related to regulatory protein involved in control of sterol uptake [Phialocephala subalpina]